jgi:hypothetical protein
LALFLVSFKKRKLPLKLDFSADFVSYALLLLVVGASLMMFWIEPHFDGDALFHIGQIRKIAENSPVSVTEAFFPIDKINAAYGYSVWYFAVALISAVSKTNVVEVWSHLIPLLIPISAFSIFAFAKSVFRNQIPALLAAVIYVFILGYLGDAWEFRIAPYPDQIARHIILFTALYSFLQFINYRARVFLLLAIFIGALLSTVHLYSWVHFLLAVGSFGIASLFLVPKRYFRDSFITGMSTLIISAPYLFLKFQDASSVIGSSVNLKKDALVLTNRLFMINPLEKSSMILLAAFILFYLVYHFRKSLRKQVWLIFIASSALAGFFIMFNPIAAPVTAKVISYTYMHRLGNMVYKELILAAFIFFVILPESVRSKFDSLAKNLVIAVVIFIVTITPFGFEAARTEEENETQVKKLIEFVKADLPERSVFASDMWTSYRIGAFSNNYIVATYPTHMTSNVHKPRRVEDLKSVFSLNTSMKETKSILDKYNVSFVVANRRPKKNDILVGQGKFKDKKDFVEIYRSEIYIVYSYNKKISLN